MPAGVEPWSSPAIAVARSAILSASSSTWRVVAGAVQERDELLSLERELDGGVAAGRSRHGRLLRVEDLLPALVRDERVAADVAASGDARRRAV